MQDNYFKLVTHNDIKHTMTKEDVTDTFTVKYKRNWNNSRYLKNISKLQNKLLNQLRKWFTVEQIQRDLYFTDVTKIEINMDDIVRELHKHVVNVEYAMRECRLIVIGLDVYKKLSMEYGPEQHLYRAPISFQFPEDYEAPRKAGGSYTEVWMFRGIEVVILPSINGFFVIPKTSR